ncbi:MAG: hypothetical protein RL607_654 [Bacteroidota bacterium]|jgi:hypothetical protein
MDTRKLGLLLLLGLVAFWATQGFDLWDSGYIAGYSWRIAQGELPYRDFFYKGPPATLFLWSLGIQFLPTLGQFFYLKCLNWMLFLLQTQLWFKGIQKGFGITLPYSTLLLGMGILFSVQFFPMYPWPTTDGLFFSSVAFYLWTLCFKKYRIHFYIPWIGLFSILAALSKQSFYVVPIAFLLATAIRYKPITVFYLALAQMASIGLFIWGFLQFTSLEQFLAHTTGETTFNDLWYTGIYNYLCPSRSWVLVWIPLGLLTIPLLIYTLRVKITWKKGFQYAAILWGIYGLFWAVVVSFQEGSRLLVLSTGLFLISYCTRNPEDRHKAGVLVLVFTAAWSASISLGYPFPIFMGSALLVILYLGINEQFPHFTPLFIGVVSIGCISGTVYQFHPYAEQPLSELHYNLGQISPKLEGIQTSKLHFEKLKDLKSLHQQYRTKKQIVAPNIPIYYYVMGIQNPLPADWLLNWEIHRDPKTLLEIASKKENVIFVEKSFVQGNELFMPKNRADFSVVSDYIVRHFQKINETKYFMVFKGTPLHAPLPQTFKTGTIQ